MATVTQRVKQVRQPRGGYINPRSMEVRQLNDGNPSPLDHTAENIHPSLVGMAVDYLARFLVGTPVKKAFAISLLGALCLDELWQAEEMLEQVTGADQQSIVNACKLAGYDVGYRTGGAGYRPVARIKPDTATIDHIRIMVQRSLALFDQYGPITLNGFRFPGAYTKLVTNGDGDFLTADTLWDFKVSVRPPTKDHTLQLLMYWIMGRRSGQPEFRSITHLGIFNPRLNSVYRIALADVPKAVITQVSHEVIGY